MNMTKEIQDEILEKVKEQIIKRKLKWCEDTEQFVEGLLLGLEIGFSHDKYIHEEDTENDDEETDKD